MESIKNTGAPLAELSPDLNKCPKNPKHIHLMGICGTGMASLAGMLKSRGYRVSGSDQNVYPPMSDFLRGLEIPVMEGYRSENLQPSPDLVIVGNVITRLNAEAIELSRRRIPYLSMPQALRVFAMEGKRNVVVCGTHGKTTTTSLIAWILDKGRKDPGFMIGGIPVNFGLNFRIGKGPFFVIEGDEYDTAFFDKGPKFLHYAPFYAVITSIEFDHADIYRDLDHVVESFRKFVKLLPPEGVLIANGDDPIVMAEAGKAACRVITYGFGADCDWKAGAIRYGERTTSLDVVRGGERVMTIETPLYGRHNLSNLLSSVVLSDSVGLERGDLLEALRTYRGVKRRQEVKGEQGGILILDDFAHHPTAVRETIRAVKERFRERRLVAVFEPRSNSSRRKVFQEAYAHAFDQAELVLVPDPPMPEKTPEEQRFSSAELVEALHKRGLDAVYGRDTAALIEEILHRCLPGDVLLFMSNGSFDNLPLRTLQKLQEQSQ
ncbi:MAG: UDP-N-acetylmuramate--L-alanine ligase [Desulfobacteraceae bacterium]|nr:MAG: UDP-N-acetylmuramate--L-alanine ligase [Desulfobacteraceae bacterium]